MNKKFIKRVSEDLMMDEDNIDNNVMEQPSMFVYYGIKWARATKKADALKINVAEVSAQREIHWRKKLAKREDKVTEAMIRAKVATDPIYKEANNDYLDAKEKAEILGVVKDGFKHRKDMLGLLLPYLMSHMHPDVKNVMKPNIEKLSDRLIKKKLKKKISDKKKKFKNKKKR